LMQALCCSLLHNVPVMVCFTFVTSVMAVPCDFMGRATKVAPHDLLLITHK